MKTSTLSPIQTSELVKIIRSEVASLMRPLQEAQTEILQAVRPVAPSPPDQVQCSDRKKKILSKVHEKKNWLKICILKKHLYFQADVANAVHILRQENIDVSLASNKLIV